MKMFFKMSLKSCIFFALTLTLSLTSANRTENETSVHKDSLDTITLQLVAPNKSKVIKVSSQFVEFLHQDLQSVIEEFKGIGCARRCADNLFYIRKMQTGYNYRSLYELFYYLSVSRECFCYDTGFFDSGVEEGGSESLSFEWNIDLSTFKKGATDQLNTSNVRHGGGGGWGSYDQGYNQGQLQGGYEPGYNNQGQGVGSNRNCRWENVFYWLIKLIASSIFDLRRVDLEDVCQDYICYRQ